MSDTTGDSTGQPLWLCSYAPGRDEAMPGTYSSARVCELVGLTYRQLDYWARTGVLRPSVAAAHGSGSARRYSEADLQKAKELVLLMKQARALLLPTRLYRQVAQVFASSSEEGL